MLPFDAMGAHLPPLSYAIQQLLHLLLPWLPLAAAVLPAAAMAALVRPNQHRLPNSVAEVAVP